MDDGPEPSFPEPASYFPFSTGRYEVAPGLMRLGKDLGNGQADHCVFQIDRAFGEYRRRKLDARMENLDTYYAIANLDPNVRSAMVKLIARRLCDDHPKWFRTEPSSDAWTLHCSLTGESLHISNQGELLWMKSTGHLPRLIYNDAFDALACQVQEDLAVIRTEDQRHWISAIHLCFPNRWAATEKIGGTFASIHAPVPHFAPMADRSEHFVRLMINATDGLVRFAWGITFDDELNHHPTRPVSQFDPSNPRAWVRVERQTILGLPEVRAGLFTIRTYHLDCTDLRTHPTHRLGLLSALRSMSDQSLAYKGLADSLTALQAWLEEV